MKLMNRVGTLARVTFVMGAIALLGGGCGGATTDDSFGASHDEIRVSSSFTSRGTGYFPDSSALEGGFVDRQGKPLKTLQQFLAGSASFVSVAMDSNAFKYGTRLRIQELNAKYGKEIIFHVVDTGGAFRGKGRSRIDICTANHKAALDPTINATLHIDVIDESGGGALPPAPTPEKPSPTPSPAKPTPTPAPEPAGSGTGTRCINDGVCNPGNDGAGLICIGGRCVAGCHDDSQCPGSKVCIGGQCK